MAIADDSLNFYGFDLYFDPDQLDLFNAVGRDFKVIGGKGNLAQALKARLETLKGEILLHPTYGSSLPTLIGEPNDETTRNMAVTMFVETMNEENRVSAVNSVSVEFDQKTRNIVRLSASIVPRNAVNQADLQYDFFL